MKLIAPDYYSRFSCIAGACKHSCCIGWEIDVDPDTREYYRTIPGEIGARLEENIVDNGETACFRMGDGERCPFLNKDNLCDLILSLGEDSLCQICDDHPRFRNFFSDRTEIGLGLCCEAAGQLILFQNDPVRFIELDDDGECDEISPYELDLLSLRHELILLAQDRSMRIEDRIDALFTRSGLNPHSDSAHWAEFLATLERMDDAWADHLNELKSIGEVNLSQNWDIPFEQLLVYLLYRHIPGALDDGELPARIAFCMLICLLLRRMFSTDPTPENLVELARLYSSEIEYSDENIEAILDEINSSCT